MNLAMHAAQLRKWLPVFFAKLVMNDRQVDRENDMVPVAFNTLLEFDKRDTFIEAFLDGRSATDKTVGCDRCGHSVDYKIKFGGYRTGSVVSCVGRGGRPQRAAALSRSAINTLIASSLSVTSSEKNSGSKTAMR